jgi:hypothetical protein
MAKELPSIGYKEQSNMQVFIVGNIFETIKALDKKRRKKQWVEVQQIIDAINGRIAWKNHPCVIQYKKYQYWLMLYRKVIEYFNMDMFERAENVSLVADLYRPPFHTEEYFTQMKRRLYEKDEEYYKQWSYLGKSLDNWYFIEGEWVKYRNGKKIIE